MYCFLALETNLEAINENSENLQIQIDNTSINTHINQLNSNNTNWFEESIGKYIFI